MTDVKAPSVQDVKQGYHEKTLPVLISLVGVFGSELPFLFHEFGFVQVPAGQGKQYQHYTHAGFPLPSSLLCLA